MYTVLTGTHGLCLRVEISKNIYPCKPHFYYIKVGCKGSKSHERATMMQSYTKFLAFYGVVVVVYVCARA